MGIWTWLKRWDDEQLLLEHRRIEAFGPRGSLQRADSGRSPPVQPVPAEEIHTHRVWHALHVALTGQEQGGSPPASYVVWTSRDAGPGTFAEADFVHPPPLVRVVADWLRSVDFESAVEELYAAIELGASVYSFTSWEGEKDIVQSGALKRVFEEVARFYASAAAADQWVEISRG